MLTADLVRATVRSGVVKPAYVDPTNADLLEQAGVLCTTWQHGVGETRAAVDEVLEDLCAASQRHWLLRGLAKLLDDRSEWATESPLDPVELRRRVFERAFASHPVGSRRSAVHRVSRDDIVAAVADELGVPVADVEVGLYADLRDAQVLRSHETIAPDALLHRYNLALAQGVLLKATELRVTVRVDRPARLRWLYRQLKFRQLMHRTCRQPDGSWQITVDGPASVLGASQRYGLQMALFVPALLRLTSWSLEADVSWGRTPRALFRLDERAGLVGGPAATGTWISDEERALTAAINGRKGGWTAEPADEVLDLHGQDVLVPDLVLRHAATGREVFVEIVGFWRRDWARRRAALLAEHAPRNLVVCFSRRLRLEREDADLDGWVEYAEVISAKKVLERAEVVG